MIKVTLISILLISSVAAKDTWKEFTGKKGESGWSCNVIHPDPKDHGPDGINLYDCDGDGLLDLFVNYEEGKRSRLYFNPSKEKLKNTWGNFIEFNHGKCEDSGMGDLDNDGDIDFIANGGWVYFNPGKEKLKDAKNWQKMTLFNKEGRVPTVADIDGDGLNDLLIAGKEWYKQPKTDKQNPANWQKFTIGETKWVMNSIIYDVDKDGDNDIVVQDRRKETFWFVNEGGEKLYKPWPRRTIYNKNNESMFMIIQDVNKDGKDDFLITGGRIGEKKQQLIMLMRTNSTGNPEFNEFILDQPKGFEHLGKDFFPKGVALIDLEGDGQEEIVIVPKMGHIWAASFQNDGMRREDWQVKILDTPGFDKRKKMDNAYLGDLDNDGDLDIVTTEENGGWGVIWFENPQK